MAHKGEALLKTSRADKKGRRRGEIKIEINCKVIIAVGAYLEGRSGRRQSKPPQSKRAQLLLSRDKHHRLISVHLSLSLLPTLFSVSFSAGISRDRIVTWSDSYGDPRGRRSLPRPHWISTLFSPHISIYNQIRSSIGYFNVCYGLL